MRRILIALVLLGSLPACLRVTNACDEQAGPCLNIDVQGAVGSIDSVRLRIQGQGNVDEEELVELPQPKELPIALGVLLGDSAEGEISITATGFLRDAGRGQGTARANLPRGGRATAIVVLGPYCGDGVVTGSEVCDDGNANNDDDCPATCRGNVCGDGFVDRQGPQTESCDDGNTSTETACPYGQATCALCDATCATVLNLTGPYCGDRNIDATAGEECDTGGADTTTCDSDCTVAFCGDNHTNPVRNEQCDDGNTRDDDDCLATCRPNVCGDTFVNRQGSRIEACDDGNTVTESACPYGTPSCNACNATCSASLALSGPYCGDGTPNGPEACDDSNTVTETTCPYGTPTCVQCNASCSAVLNLSGPYCGDGTPNGPEACDDGNSTTESACPYGQAACTRCNSTCTIVLSLTGPYCGDGTPNGPESCDDGNTTTETACPYGIPSCTACNATCTAALNIGGPYCGDGTRNGPEACDDGNSISETACPYGQATCTRCDSNCTTALNLTGAYCGDGVVNGPEACDDGNNLVCGTCDSTCTTSQDAAATGSITAIQRSNLSDGQTFTLNDGVNTPTIFEFDLAFTGVVPGRTPVNVPSSTNTSDQVAAAIAAAITGVGSTLLISVSSVSNNFVSLIHDQPGSFGNQPIFETVPNSGFIVRGMSGGGGHDCPASIGCTTNADCASGLSCQGTGPKTCQ